MRRIVAMLAGAVLAMGLFLSPVADAAVRTLTTVKNPEQRSVRVLNYESPGHREDPESLYRKAIAGTPAGVTNLYLMGSSELGMPVEQNPAGWVPSNSSDFDMYLSGRGNQQSLYHAIELAAVGSDIANKKVALILSPQWFMQGGTKASLFKSVFSHMAWDAMLNNPKLSGATKKRLIARVGSLMPELCTLATSCATATASKPEQIINAPYAMFTSRINALRDTYKGADYRKAVSYTGAWQPGKQSMATIDWDAENAKATKVAQAQVGICPYNMDDGYYKNRIEPQLDKFGGRQSNITYSTSVEYDDLQLFLDVARELGIDVMLVSLPVNGAWSDFSGLPKAERDAFASNIKSIAATNGAKLTDLTSKAYEPYYFYDTLHLGWRGWLDVTRACWEFARP